jgi:exodeoxyribonuclease VII large subunit
MNSNNALSVSDINALVKKILSESLNMTIYVEGEISGLKLSNGNLFFHLKDNNSIISAVFWRIGKCNYTDGDKVKVKAKLSPLVNHGTYKLTVYSIEKDGIGDFHIKYEQLKNKLNDTQYFSKKRKLPSKINRIGILTALEGAALQDIKYVLENNNYIGEIYIKNCIVQGNQCPKSVKEGIQYFNKLSKKTPIDILIIGRGGGSFEDLMGYSTEEVVKAIYDSDIFTISAVGHEVDTMLSDLAADFRAPTPSIAGETIIKLQRKQFENIYNQYENLKHLEHMIQSEIFNYENKLENLKCIHESFNPENIINNTIYKYQNILREVHDNIVHEIHDNYHELEKIKNSNNMFDTSKILKSGYTVVTNDKGDLIETAEQFKKSLRNNEQLQITFRDQTVNLDEMLKIKTKK